MLVLEPAVKPRKAWGTSLQVIKPAMDSPALSPSFLREQAELRLITRSGFEQKHILTSQIGSL
jgi:hypothetical protein